MRVRRVVVTSVILAAACALAAANLAGPARPPTAGVHIRMAGDRSAAVENGSFTVSGSVEGLYPGATKPLPLEITNPYDFEIEVVALDAEVDAAQNCPADRITVNGLADVVKVAPNSTKTTDLSVAMSRSAGDACQQAVFPLRFSGRAQGDGPPATPAPSDDPADSPEPTDEPTDGPAPSGSPGPSATPTGTPRSTPGTGGANGSGTNRILGSVSSPPPLPRTGAPIVDIALVGIALVAFGGSLVVVAGRRRHRDGDA